RFDRQAGFGRGPTLMSGRPSRLGRPRRSTGGVALVRLRARRGADSLRGGGRRGGRRRGIRLSGLLGGLRRVVAGAGRGEIIRPRSGGSHLVGRVVKLGEPWIRRPVLAWLFIYRLLRRRLLPLRD